MPQHKHNRPLLRQVQTHALRCGGTKPLFLNDPTDPPGAEWQHKTLNRRGCAVAAQKGPPAKERRNRRAAPWQDN